MSGDTGHVLGFYDRHPITAADVLTRHAAAIDIAASALRAARRLEHSHARLMAALASADEAATTTPRAALRAIAARDAAMSRNRR